MDRSYKRSLSSSSYSPLGSRPLRSENAAVEIGEGGIPQPLDCLLEAPIPPFLSKTYDLVDDPGLDQIISWSDTGASFIVWDPVEFARLILPKNFKHNNLSSFVRQLNTYGFRKIDTDRWEFACESFLKGKRHLLKNIRRRKSHSSGNEEWNPNSIEAELECLHKEKMEMMQEVIQLQQQQRGTHQYLESVNQKLQAAENRQKQMVASLAKVFKISTFRERNRISSPRKVRKFVMHQSQDLGLGPIPVDDNDGNLDSGPEIVPLQLYDTNSQEPSQPKDLIKQEDIWSLDFETIAAMPNSGDWNDVGNYELPEFGGGGGGELSDFWNLASSGGENGESSFGKTNQYGF
ncbi:hypothetical protein L2E82_05685 [Cichorium intybus]|uniref:Uncharacterized protein n=1 Tax=Cichorium intybus TaxID=13427 RepID=A0ACB9H8F1_CICIN|nr:hypothetical protein L2E82_05685 [Cichorium intybus]